MANFFEIVVKKETVFGKKSVKRHAVQSEYDARKMFVSIGNEIASQSYASYPQTQYFDANGFSFYSESGPRVRDLDDCQKYMIRMSDKDCTTVTVSIHKKSFE